MQTLLGNGPGFCFGEAIYPKGGRYGPLLQGYISLLFVLEGRMTVNCDGDVTELYAGQCGFFLNRKSLTLECPSGFSSRVAWCEGRASASHHERVSRSPSPTPIETVDKIAALLSLGLELGGQSSANLNELRNSLGETIFLAFFCALRSDHRERSIPPSISQTRKYIEQNFAQELCVEQLAARTGITPQHLVSSFRKHMGITPVRYLWQVRATHGHSLLLRTGLPISDIAYRCGYKTPFHFSRQITEQYGMSPRQVRANRGYHLPSNIAESVDETGAIVIHRN